MKYIPLTKNKITIVNDEYYDTLSQYKWYFGNGYAMRIARINDKRTTILMHRAIIQLSGKIIPTGVEIDHKSRNKLDNRIENLRMSTKSQNGQNNTIHSNNTSGYKGVYWSRANNKWHVQIWVNRIRKHLGYFDNIVEAAQAYDKAAIKYHREFAVPNING